MLRPAPAQPPVAPACRRRTPAALQSGDRRVKPRRVHCHILCVRLLLPRPSSGLLCHPPAASDSASRSAPAFSVPCPAVYRTLRCSTRSLRTQTLLDLLPHGFDAAHAVVLFPRCSPFQFSIRMHRFIDGFALTLTIYRRYLLCTGTTAKLKRPSLDSYQRNSDWR